MDEANLTMEEYIKLEAEKARRHDSSHLLMIFNETHKISSEPMVRPLDNNEIDFRISFDESDDEDYICIYDKNLFSYKLISVNDLKTDSENGIDEVSIPPNDVVIKQMDSGIDYNIDTQSHEFDEDFETNHDIHREPSNMEDYLIIIEVIWHHYHLGLKDTRGSDMRLRDILTSGLTEEMGMSMDARLSMEHTDAQGQVVFTSHSWRRMFEIKGPLVRELMLEFFSTCRFADIVLNLEDAGTFSFQLGGANRQMRWRHSDGRKRGAQMFGGHFITCLADHFGMLTEERLQGTTVVVGQLIEIDLDELSRRHIYGALEDVEGAPAIDEGVQAVPAPNHAPQALIDAPVMRIMPQRMARIEEEVYGLKESLGRGIA
ncbi:hypothetical protein Tco_1266357 [Tanacetum coccineum]